MSLTNRRMGSKSAPYMQDDKSGSFRSPGPYIGIVKNNIDPTRGGRLQVYIPQFGASTENDPSSWITVSYSSPYRGQTRQRVSVDSYIDPSVDFTNTDENSFQSYGFWGVPVDLNTKVLIMFVNGDVSQGYWFGCVGDPVDSHMIPGIGAVPASTGPNDGGYIWQPTGANAIPTHTMLQQYIELNQDGQTEIPYRLPVSEPVLSSQDAVSPTAPQTVQMVPQVFQTKQLGIQGLAFDFIRGSTSASSIRENPSQVFGISTPGRLTSFANVDQSAISLGLANSFLNANASSSTANTGSQDDLQKVLTCTYRTGGHQFVMDDGTVDGYDQGIRIRSTAGNEILLDDTNGQIYIINSTGSAWIELSPSGYIDIYAQSDFSVRSQGSINLHADKDINLNAGGQLQMHSGGGTKIDSGGALSARSASDITVFSGGTLGIGSTGALNLSGKGSMGLQSSGAVGVKGSQINLNSGSVPSVSDPGAISMNTQIEVSQQPGSKVWWQTGQFTSACGRAPAHEPWPGHEVDGIETFNIAQGTFSGSAITNHQTGTTSSGIRGTSTGRAINAGDLAKQPTVGVVCRLTVNQTRALCCQIGQRESGGNYAARNSIGYSGKYQFGAEALEATGYLRPGSSKRGTNLTVLNNASNWSGLNGCYSVNDWLNNHTAQEQAMILLLKKNCQQLTGMGILNSSTSADDVGGYLMAAHLVGVGGASNLYKIQHNMATNPKYRTSDQNGTSALSYYSLGSRAVDLGTHV